MLAACDGTTLHGMRNRALIVTLWRSGLRCSEAIGLHPYDIDFDACTVRVRHGKNDKSRTVGIDGQALEVVRAWMNARQLAGWESQWLFCTRTGAQVADRYVRSMVARLAVQAGVQHRAHPHAFRHTLACELVREKWPVPLISRQLGHSNIGTTEVYLQNLQPSEVIERARARVWA